MRKTEYFCDRCGTEVAERGLSTGHWVVEGIYLSTEVCSDCYKAILTFIRSGATEVKK